ncbi:MAG: hypothetical protein PGN22_02935 [Agrobacterium cavarae]
MLRNILQNRNWKMQRMTPREAMEDRIDQMMNLNRMDLTQKVSQEPSPYWKTKGYSATAAAR